MAMVLVVDDRADHSESSATRLRLVGHAVHATTGRNDALSALGREVFDAVVIDLKMAHALDSLHLLCQVKAHTPDVEVVVTGPRGMAPLAETFKLGEYEYLSAPVESSRLLDAVSGAAARTDATRRAADARRRWNADASDTTVVAVDPVTRALFARVSQIAAAEVHVLITGESGTGKELVARMLHRLSRRASDKFVPLNCASVPESLVDSELFGYKRGAFTGAVEDKKGITEESDGGMLFLDEVGDMPSYVQVSLLRFLDTGEFRRVGDTKVRHADVRVVAATHRDLASEIAQGRFREDLFYRLGAISIDIPPLRERPAEILPLALRSLQEAAARMGKVLRGFDDEALTFLEQYHWPGNVRQLKSAIEGAVVLATRDRIAARDLVSTMSPAVGALPGVTDAEHQRVLDALERCAGNHTQAAYALGISRTTLWRKLRRAKTAIALALLAAALLGVPL